MGGLIKCLGTEIGSTMARGVSGGELKRVNIANEILAKPRVLILDEPTSGLDSTCAFTVMSSLRDFARQDGIALVCSIHQPSSRIASLFDRVMLLTPSGRTAFIGTMEFLWKHLERLGHRVPDGFTLTDHAMELLCEEVTASCLLDAWNSHLTSTCRAEVPSVKSNQINGHAPVHPSHAEENAS